MSSARKRIDLDGRPSIQSGEPSEWVLAYAKSKFKIGEEVDVVKWLEAIDEGRRKEGLDLLVDMGFAEMYLDESEGQFIYKLTELGKAKQKELKKKKGTNPFEI